MNREPARKARRPAPHSRRSCSVSWPTRSRAAAQHARCGGNAGAVAALLGGTWPSPRGWAVALLAVPLVVAVDGGAKRIWAARS
jgi:hypothetical protein